MGNIFHVKNLPHSLCEHVLARWIVYEQLVMKKK